ncbi:uncharacterized protein FYW61_002357 isoform 2-T2 [Anableps anableps]
MVFVVNMDLGMGVGKIAAQVGHAAVGLYQALQEKNSWREMAWKWDHSGNRVVYNREQLINMAKAEIIRQLKPEIPEELKRRRHGCRAGAERRERRRKFKPSLPSIIMGNGQEGGASRHQRGPPAGAAGPGSEPQPAHLPGPRCRSYPGRVWLPDRAGHHGSAGDGEQCHWQSEAALSCPGVSEGVWRQVCSGTAQPGGGNLS